MRSAVTVFQNGPAASHYRVARSLPQMRFMANVRTGCAYRSVVCAAHQIYLGTYVCYQANGWERKDRPVVSDWRPSRLGTGIWQVEDRRLPTGTDKGQMLGKGKLMGPAPAPSGFGGPDIFWSGPNAGFDKTIGSAAKERQQKCSSPAIAKKRESFASTGTNDLAKMR